MTPEPQTESRRNPRPVWLMTIGAALVLVLVAVGYVQWRQFKLLDTTSSYQNDALGWSFSQLETQQLRLRNQMQASVTARLAAGTAEVQLQYDIFVSRIGLIDHPRAARLMADQAAYRPALAQVKNFVREADQYFGESPRRRLDETALAGLLIKVDALGMPLHDLSLGATHLLYQRATERNAAVRQQSQISIALTVFQCVLLLALAAIVLRQFGALAERRRSLEELATSLNAARADAEAASRSKSLFLANMSHEIRTPFHGMLGMMSLLQDSRLAPNQAAHLDTARESAHHLLEILNDILDISQLESGKLHVVPETVDLPQLVSQVEALMRAQALTKGLVLRLELAADVPRWVRADATRVKQILFNLLSNAIKFSSVGTVTLQVGSRRGESAHEHVVFTVTDSGIGMTPELVERLFQRFTQGDSSRTRQAAGTGLGLEISRDLARLMGGDITVRSELGVGSSFRASLPLAAVAAPTARAAGDESEAPGDTRPLRVLVAEDHAVNRAYMEAVLGKLGHYAFFSADGDGAVRAVQAQAPGEEFDIVLMDLHMPGMDGFAAARAIRAMPVPRGRVPIVALTADAFHEARALARDAGMDGFLTKPAHLPQLREALARHSGARPAAPREPVEIAAVTPLAEGRPALDTAIIADLIKTLSAEKYAELLATFYRGREQTVADMRQAVAVSAQGVLLGLAHGLKGASASLGFGALAACAARVPPETADAAVRVAWVDQIEREFAIAETRSAAHTTTGSASSRMPKRP